MSFRGAVQFRSVNCARRGETPAQPLRRAIDGHSHIGDGQTPARRQWMIASSTHLFKPCVAMKLKAALDFGASRAELMDALELTSPIGIHAANAGGRDPARNIE
ncbi:hypothetical protein [Burkholderia sp. PU8-34]